MTRVTFGVSASSFMANMCVKQNAIELRSQYAAKQVETSFYVDDYLGGADSPQEEMCALLQRGGFLLRKWSGSDKSLLERIPSEWIDSQASVILTESDQYTKTLGIEWNSSNDHFRVCVSELPLVECMTKRSLTADIARTFDVLGWYSPTIIMAKILLQKLWLEKIGWDDCVPKDILEAWTRWRQELPLLSNHYIPRCYYPKEVTIVSTQLHGFSDASKLAYSAVVYMRLEDGDGHICTSIITSKTRVVPIKCVTIPRLELMGALMLAQILDHCKKVLGLPLSSVHAWTDSTIVLDWIQGNPRRFKLCVGNRVAQILELTPAGSWNHVVSGDNQADCASRGVFPSDLLKHTLWWSGPSWLKSHPSKWPKNNLPKDVTLKCTEELIFVECNVTLIEKSIMPADKFSSITRYKRVTAYVYRLIRNCKARIKDSQRNCGPLIVEKLNQAANYWYSIIQKTH